jgi:predicted lipoprotein with Yx(FWY)xxD motif
MPETGSDPPDHDQRPNTISEGAIPMDSKDSRTRTPKRHRLARLAVATAAIGTGWAVGPLALGPPAGAASGVTVKLMGHGSLGKILVNGAGQTVYIYTADSANKSACTGTCATVWPPVTIPKGTKPKGGPGVKKLGTVTFDGKLQLTWNKHPLYTYVLDTGPGVVNGNAVKEGSGVWYAATVKNASVAAKAASKTTSPAGSSTGY